MVPRQGPTSQVDNHHEIFGRTKRNSNNQSSRVKNEVRESETEDKEVDVSVRIVINPFEVAVKTKAKKTELTSTII